MTTRRKFWTYLATAFVVASVFVVGSVAADELIGYISKVDIEGKKLTVVDKDDKSTDVTVTGDTEWVTKKGTTKIDLEKVSAQVTKATDAGKKVNVTVTHEKGTASKIEQKAGKKKAAAPTNPNN